MENLAIQPAALDLLEVTTTAAGPADPEYHIFREWCAWTADERSAALLSFDLTGIMYVNNDLDFQAISIISPPANRPQQKRMVYWSIHNLSEPGTIAHPIQSRHCVWRRRRSHERALRKRARISLQSLKNHHCC